MFSYSLKNRINSSAAVLGMMICFASLDSHANDIPCDANETTSSGTEEEQIKKGRRALGCLEEIIEKATVGTPEATAGTPEATAAALDAAADAREAAADARKAAAAARKAAAGAHEANNGVIQAASVAPISLSEAVAWHKIVQEGVTKNENIVNFRDFSIGVGTAVLHEPSFDGSNGPVSILEAHALFKTWNDNKAGVGPFFAVKPTEGFANYVGAGILFSLRKKDDDQPFNFGAGYMIDREGFVDETMKRQGDRSGFFLMVSFNGGPPVDSFIKLFTQKK